MWSLMYKHKNAEPLQPHGLSDWMKTQRFNLNS